MSNTSQGPGWWMASDGKWYPPELWTGPPNTSPGNPTGQPGDQPAGPPTAQPVQPAQPSAQSSAQPMYPVQGQSYGAGSGASAPMPQGPPAYGASSYANAGYGLYSPQGQSPYGRSMPRKTNGLAIASLVCSCAGIFLIGIPAVVGIIFGFVARGQIRRSNGAQGGAGLALAGIIVGFVVVGLLILAIVVRATQHNQNTAIVGLVLGAVTGLG